jgi:GT2 family glycosyltransferase
MNLGIRESTGDYIIRLDAHCFYPFNYFSKLIEYAERLNSDNVGGICMTDVKIKNQKSLAIKEVLGNKFGVGNSTFRTGTSMITEVDTVPFGCFRKDVFERFGLYDERLVRNQDIELNKRILRGGGRIYLVPEIQCTYFARETFGSLMKNNFLNGLWNILTVYYTKNINSLSLRHFIPLLFVFSLIIPPLLGFVYSPLLLLGCASLLMYILLMLLISIYLSTSKKLSIHYLFLSFFFLHFSYGLGSLVAILKIPFFKSNL